MPVGSIETRPVETFVPDPGLLERYADLIVGFCANVQPGQVVAISTDPGKEALSRHVANAAYKYGAKYVEAYTNDPYISRRARIAHTALADDLDFEPEWPSQRLIELCELHAARIALSGYADPGIVDGLDPQRAGRVGLAGRKVQMQVIGQQRNNWTMVPCPTEPWASVVHPEVSSAEAIQKLWEQVVHVSRLDEEDPITAWRERQDFLTGIAARLTGHQFGALHFEEPRIGTNLTVGLLPSSKWGSARFETVTGIQHMANCPSEEVFTAPDPGRINGRVVSTKPLELKGSIVEGIDMTFLDGEAVRVDASKGAEVLRAHMQKDAGAKRLGEVALVDSHGRIGPLNTTFFDTLLDENAASHLAIGAAYPFTVGESDRARINKSQVHNDFMIGSENMRVTGVSATGDKVPVLVNGEWQI